jgi:hypothetical protein
MFVTFCSMFRFQISGQLSSSIKDLAEFATANPLWRTPPLNNIYIATVLAIASRQEMTIKLGN